MIYLVGGASRAGKSTLARRLVQQQGIPYFPIDALMMAFANGYAAFGMDPNTPSETRGEQLWPILRALAVNLLEEERTHPTYLLEGDELLPKYVAELSSAYPGQVRACFIGYTRAAPAEKLQQVRQAEPDWNTWCPDQDVLAFLAYSVRFSRYLESECAAYGLPYFDGSDDFARATEEAGAYLLAG